MLGFVSRCRRAARGHRHPDRAGCSSRSAGPGDRDAVADSGLATGGRDALSVSRQGAAGPPTRPPWGVTLDPRRGREDGRLGDPTGDRLSRRSSGDRPRRATTSLARSSSSALTDVATHVAPRLGLPLFDALNAHLPRAALAVLPPRRSPFRAERGRAPVRDPARTDPVDRAAEVAELVRRDGSPRSLPRPDDLRATRPGGGALRAIDSVGTASATYGSWPTTTISSRSRRRRATSRRGSSNVPGRSFRRVAAPSRSLTLEWALTRVGGMSDGRPSLPDHGRLFGDRGRHGTAPCRRRLAARPRGPLDRQARSCWPRSSVAPTRPSRSSAT